MSIPLLSNTGNIVFNSYLLLFLRSWYLPWDPDKDEPMQDSWFRMPAHKSEGPNGVFSYIPLNTKAESLSPLIISEDESIVLRVGQEKPRRPIPKGLLLSVMEGAVDVVRWEQKHNKPYPFASMFSHELVLARRSALGVEGSAPGIDPNVALIRKAIHPRPCQSCGRRRG